VLPVGGGRLGYCGFVGNDGQVVGGIGVSGGHWTEDSEVAEAGLSAIAIA